MKPLTPKVKIAQQRRTNNLGAPAAKQAGPIKPGQPGKVGVDTEGRVTKVETLVRKNPFLQAAKAYGSYQAGME